jgi:hypothetical protein
MCIIAHLIDNERNLHKITLNFYQVSNHIAEKISQVIENYLLEWGIDKVLTIIADSVSSNNVTISFLNNVMKDWPTNIFLNKHLNVRCCANIVNLILCDGLK